VFVVAFLSIFVAAGVAIGYFLSFRPLYHVWQAQSWTPADCEVISSRLISSGDTSRPEIRYRYSIADRQYTSDRYNFISGSTNDSSIGAAVQQYQPGMRFQCFVDPADPQQAVINRGISYWYFFGLLFFAGFAGIPLLVGAFVVRQFSAARAAQQVTSMSPQVPPMTPQVVSMPPQAALMSSGVAVQDGSIATVVDVGPVVLHPTVSPMGKLILAMVFCLFWNGIVGVFTYFEIQQFASGESGGWFMAIFLLLFQIIGVGLLLNVPYQMLALANPRPTITLSRATLPIGGAVPFEWRLTGAASRVSRLTVTLKGREEARYRRGTDTRTDTHQFHSEVLAEAADPMTIERGSGTIRVPVKTMHSFSSNNNKIVWTITVKGEISRWPDVDESFDVTVSPA